MFSPFEEPGFGDVSKQTGRANPGLEGPFFGVKMPHLLKSEALKTESWRMSQDADGRKSASDLSNTEFASSEPRESSWISSTAAFVGLGLRVGYESS